MKKIIAIILATVTLYGVNYYTHNYKRNVYVISNEREIVTVSDDYGHIWQFKGNGSKANEELILHMHTNGTENNIKDDKIIGII